jgi:tRNA(Arg) A34 adenosine deaminase TadA
MLEIYETTEDVFMSKNGIIKLDSNKSLSNKQKRLLTLACKLAEASELPQKHGAVIVKSGRVLTVGVNRWRNKNLTHTEPEYNPNLTYHAEIDALNRFQDVTGATIYIARVGKNNEPRFSRPCSRCLIALKDAGVKKIIYTTNDMGRI